VRSRRQNASGTGLSRDRAVARFGGLIWQALAQIAQNTVLPNEATKFFLLNKTYRSGSGLSPDDPLTGRQARTFSPVKGRESPRVLRNEPNKCLCINYFVPGQSRALPPFPLELQLRTIEATHPERRLAKLENLIAGFNEELKSREAPPPPQRAARSDGTVLSTRQLV